MRRIAPLLITLIAFVVGYVQKLPCHVAGWPWQRELIFGEYCYSDVPILFRDRGLMDGVFPYALEPPKQPLEYPVVTGYVMDWTARLSRLLAPGADAAAGSRAYFLVNLVLLLGFGLLTVWAVTAVLRRTGGRDGDVLLVAAAPTLVLAGTINWDLVAVAAAVLALLAWVRDRPLLAGVLIGLGTAAKLFPLFILGPLLVLCLRRRQLAAYGRTVGGAVVAWVAVNLPVLVRYPDGWLEFWRFNADRGADFGSIWYASLLLGHPVPAVNTVAVAVLGVLCAGIAALARWAPRPPSAAQLAFLVVAAFLLTNKVYSPQYVLWLLPLAVLARAHVPFGRTLRDWAIWQATEVLYWVAVWRYLAGTLAEDWHYPGAIILRVAATAYLCAQVVRDVFVVPAAQPDGSAQRDDPDGSAEPTDPDGSAEPTVGSQTAFSLRQADPSAENAV